MALKNHSLTTPAKPEKISAIAPLMPEIEKLSESDLYDLRHELDLRLQLDLGQLNLAEELALQFRQAKAMLHAVQNDDDIPTNQKSQMLNSTRSMLTDIVKQQEIVWSAERLKIFEVAFVKASALLSAEAREAFFDLYGKFLKDPQHVAESAEV